MNSISIALCTFNGARFLAEQLDSIAAQTRLPDELVVCDDQSTDETFEIIKQFARRVAFPVRSHRNPDRLGSTKNYEQAIGSCQGKIIALCDQDDWWRPDKLLKLERALAESPQFGAAFSDADLVDEHRRPLNHRLWQAGGFGRRLQMKLCSGQGFGVLLKRQVAVGTTLAYRREFQRYLLPIPEQWVHDGWIALIIAAQADLAIVPEPLVQYRQHPNQQLGAGHAKSFEIKSRLKCHGPAYFANETRKFEILHERLTTAAEHTIRPVVLEHLTGKVAHLRARTALPNSPVRRVPGVLAELLAGRYSRYSNSWISAVRDIVCTPASR